MAKFTFLMDPDDLHDAIQAIIRLQNEQGPVVLDMLRYRLERALRVQQEEVAHADRPARTAS